MYKSHFPKSPDLPPPHNQPFPTTNSSGKGDKSHRQPLHHPPILATRPQTSTQTHEGPLPYLRPNAHAEGAAVCHLVQVQLCPRSREGTRSKEGWGAPAHACGLAGQVVIMAWGSTQCPRQSQSCPGPWSHLPNIPHSLRSLSPSSVPGKPGQKSNGLKANEQVLDASLLLTGYVNLLRGRPVNLKEPVLYAEF